VLAPERHSRRDLLAAAAIVVVVAVAAAVVWVRSDARATTSITAASPLPALVPAAAPPTSLTPLWTAPSAATRVPAVAAGAVVTGDGSGVQGRDPSTGTVVWSYTRDLALCAVTAEWSRAVAVYRDGQGCSQVTSLEGATGERGPQRSSEADDAVTLTGDGTYLTSVGSTRLEVWRSDLVRTLEYGRVDQLISPGFQPRTGCTLRSAASVPARLTVVETCPGDAADRLTLLDPAPADAAKPEVRASVLLPSSGARVLAVTATEEAVLLPGADGGPQVAVYSGAGVLLSQAPVPLTAADLAALTSSPVLPTVATGAVTVVTVGTTALALGSSDLALRWSTAGVLGAGTLVGGALLVPTDGAVTELDPATGTVGRAVPVDRGGWAGPVELSTAGPVLLEQRGPTLAALGS
jgi:hypothetical protein